VSKSAGVLLLLLAWWGDGRPCAAAAGAEPFDFLFLDANARAVGLGGAYTALARDSNALLYNPAGLGRVGRHEATFMHNSYFEGVSQEYLSFASRRGWGLAVNYLDYGDVPRTTISQPNETLGKFSASDMAVSAGYGRAVLLEGLSLGGGFKFIREALGDASAQGYALDAGALYDVPGMSGLSLGLALQNIGPTVRFQRAKENLPLNLRLGGGYSFAFLEQKCSLSLDIMKERSQQALIAFGAETVVNGRMPVRLGFGTRNQAGPGISAGVGWLFERFALDYAFVPFGELGSAHRISATLLWGEEGPRRAASGPAEPRRPLVAEEPPALDKPEDHFKLADDLVEIDLLDAAKKELRAADALMGEEDQERVGYLARMGRIAYLEKNCASAKARFTDALRLAIRLRMMGADAAQAYAGMGLCLEEERNNPYAMKFYRKALEAGADSKTRRLVQERLKNLRQ